MNDNFYKTEDNKKVIGRIFEEYVPKIIESTDNDLSKKAIKFIGNWYPIAKSDNSKYEGLKLVKEGYKLAMDLCRNQSLERNIFKQIEEEYQDKITIERIKNEKLKIVLRELFSIPGTYTILEGNKEYPGFFQIYNSSLLRTDSIVMFLPIHPNSKVKIIRPIPKIPGVPDNATTIPPVYSEYLLSENQLIELSLYELKEKCGLIPDLPIGFTYNSGVFKEKQKEIDGYDPEDNKLPSNTISRPTRIAKTTFPPGFLQKCPFYGFDNSKFDKSTIQSSTQSSEVVFTNSYENTLNIPKGATTENTPVIWPNKNMNLKTFNDVSDFPENAPLIMEIIEPNDIKVRRIKFKINKVDNDMCTIDDNIKRDEGEKVLKRGETFNIYVINRTSSKFENEWIPINMEVIDEEYKDDDDDHIDKYFKKSSFSSKENIVPIPAGLSQSGYPYFAPPINIPPFPVGYTEDGIPYYGKKSTIKPIPYGLTNDGLRFYPTSENITAISEISHAVVAGYCNNGQPFFLPKFCYLPKPSGFTAEGVPYYDIQSFIHQDGYIMSSMDKNIIDEVIKEKEKIKKASSQESENKEKQNKKKKKKKNKKINDYEEFKEFEDENVKTDEEIKKERIENLIKKLIRNNKVIGKQFNVLKKLYKENNNNNINIANKNIEELNDELNLLSTPSDLLKYIKSIDLKKKEKSNKIKFAYEPNTLHFQSVNLSVTKTINIKFIADNVSNSKEYKYYINVSPSKIFDTSESVLKVYNNKVYPISITFNPKFLTSEYTEGEISIIDSKGKSYMSCKLSAIKKSFIEVSHETINMGWIFPNKSSEFPLVIENKSSIAISVTVRLKHGEYIDNDEKINYKNINKRKKLFKNKENKSSIRKNIISSDFNINRDKNSFNSSSKSYNNINNYKSYTENINSNNISDNINIYTNENMIYENDDDDNNSNNNDNNNNNNNDYNNENNNNSNFNNNDNNNNNNIINGEKLRNSKSNINLNDKNNIDNNDENSEIDDNNDSNNKSEIENNKSKELYEKSSSSLEIIDDSDDITEKKVTKLNYNTGDTENLEIVTESVAEDIDSNYEDNYNNINEQNDNSSKQNLSENENISQINSNNYLKYEKNPFSISLQLFQLNPLERKVINVHFEPEKLGKYEEQIEIFAPGGDAKVVTIKGKCGIPIGVYPEDSKNSKVRTQDLEYERNEVVKIIVNEDLSDTIDIPDKKNEQIIKSLQMAINDGKYRNILHTIDFGIFINKEMKQRSLTLMNFTNDEIKIGLFTTSHILFFDDFITIPKQSAKVVDINVNFGYYHNKESFKGIINEKIELLCSGINNICINVKGYVGQPLLIPTWELCFFTPCTINTKSSLNMSLINYCQYDLSIIIKFPRESDELNYITSSISDDSSDPTLVKAFSTIPISFIYNAEERGLTLKHVLIKIIKPFKKEISCGLTEKGIYLIGTCLFPYKKKLIPNSDYNSLEFISSWLSHPRRILSEFPSISEMKKMFLRITNDNDDIDYNQLIKFQRNYITFYSISEQKSRI
jgi:hypothetical protein